MPDAEDAWLTREGEVVSWTPPVTDDADGLDCEPRGWPDTTEVETVSGALFVDAIDLTECPWSEFFDSGAMTEFVAPLGRGLGAVQMAVTGFGLSEGNSRSWTWQIWAAGVAGVPPRSLLTPLLDTVAPGSTSSLWITTEEQVLDGQTLFVMSAPGHAACLFYSLSERVVVVLPSFDCAEPMDEVAAHHAALLAHLEETWALKHPLVRQPRLPLL